MMVQLPKNFQARQFKETEDIVHYDMVLVMDKFTAADVLREVMKEIGLNVQLHRCALAQEGIGAFLGNTAL